MKGAPRSAPPAKSSSTNNDGILPSHGQGGILASDGGPGVGHDQLAGAAVAILLAGSLDQPINDAAENLWIMVADGERLLDEFVAKRTGDH